jgi:2,4-dihydroxyhept-2-ene-1,7-dioic acid aldolase
MMRRLVMAGAVLLIGTCGTVQAQQVPKLYNTTKQKLLDGKQVVGGTVFSPDPAMYCAMANAGFDFLWIEMQHSPLTYQEVARMIFACRGSAGCRSSAFPTRPRATSRRRPISAPSASSFPPSIPSRRPKPR